MVSGSSPGSPSILQAIVIFKNVARCVRSGQPIIALRLDIPDVLLDRDGREQAEHEGHRVEPLFAQGQRSVPQPDSQQQDAHAQRGPTQAEIDGRDGNTLDLIVDRLLQRYGREEAVEGLG